jgi:hypothetical protein
MAAQLGASDTPRKGDRDAATKGPSRVPAALPGVAKELQPPLAYLYFGGLLAMAETTMKPTVLGAKLCAYFSLPGLALVWPKGPFIKKFLEIWT